VLAAEDLGLALVEVRDTAIREYGEGPRFRSEGESIDLLYEYLVCQYGNTTVKKKKRDQKYPDITVREDRKNGISVERLCHTTN